MWDFLHLYIDLVRICLLTMFFIVVLCTYLYISQILIITGQASNTRGVAESSLEAGLISIYARS